MQNKKTMMSEEHIQKRETTLGRWFPFALYGINVFLWFLTGLLFGQWQLLWLAFLPLAALAVYWFRTRTILP
jgi:hypothetical protein